MRRDRVEAAGVLWQWVLSVAALSQANSGELRGPERYSNGWTKVLPVSGKPKRRAGSCRHRTSPFGIDKAVVRPLSFYACQFLC